MPQLGALSVQLGFAPESTCGGSGAWGFQVPDPLPKRRPSHPKCDHWNGSLGNVDAMTAFIRRLAVAQVATSHLLVEANRVRHGPTRLGAASGDREPGVSAS
jgi:hypothetical protein